MLDFLKKLFPESPKSDLKALVTAGATIVDVRTKAEYQGGHIRGSINIPLNELTQSLSILNPAKPIITCCASGMRSSSAKSVLKNNGFQEVHNGGGWMALEQQLRK